MKLFNFRAICFTGLLLGLAQGSATAFTLDAFTSFQSGAFQLQLEGQTSDPPIVENIETGLDSTVFGNARKTRLTRTSTTNSPFASTELSVFPIDSSSGFAQLETSTSFTSTAEIIYEGLDLANNTNNPKVGENITMSGGNVQRSIEIIVDRLVIGGGGPGTDTLDFNIQLGDINDNTATITRTMSNNITSPQSIHFAYDDIPASNLISLTEIDYIRFFTSKENAGDDFDLTFIQTSEKVPFEFSPGLGLILGGSLFGFLKLRKKLQQN